MIPSKSISQPSLFITEQQGRQIQQSLLNTGGRLQSSTVGTLSGGDAVSRRSNDLAGGNLLQPSTSRVDPSSIARAIGALNRERGHDASSTLGQKVQLVEAKILDMRRAQAQQSTSVPASTQTIARGDLEPDIVYEPSFEADDTIKSRSRESGRDDGAHPESQKHALARAIEKIARYHTRSIDHIGDDEGAEALFIRRFAQAMMSQDGVQSTEPKETVLAISEHLAHFLASPVFDELLTTQERTQIAQYAEELSPLVLMLEALEEDYSKASAQALASTLSDQIKGLKAGQRCLLPVSWKSGDGMVLHLVSITCLRAQASYRVSINAANIIKDSAHPKVNKPVSAKPLYQKFITLERVPMASLIGDGLSLDVSKPTLLEGLLELSLRPDATPSDNSLYLLLGHLRGVARPVEQAPSQYRSSGRWATDHVNTLERELEKGFVLENPDLAQGTASAERAKLALRLHELEAYFLSWQPLLATHDTKETLIERTIENLARRAEKLHKRGYMNEAQTQTVLDRIETLRQALVLTRADHQAHSAEQAVLPLTERLADQTPLSRTEGRGSIKRAPSPFSSQGARVTIERPQRLRAPNVETPRSPAHLLQLLDQLSSFNRIRNQGAAMAPRVESAITDFVRALPLPSNNLDDVWHQIPIDEIASFSRRLSHVAELYIKNENGLDQRLPERALVVGKTVVLLALLAQRVPELGLERRFVQSLETYLQHEYTDYGYYLNASDGQQFYQLVCWVDQMKQSAEGPPLSFELPEVGRRLEDQKIAVLTQLNGTTLHQPTLEYFCSFVMGSSKEKTLRGKPNEAFNPLRKQLKTYLKTSIDFPQTTAKQRRHLRRDNDVLAMTLLSDLGTDSGKGFFQGPMKSLNDLRRLLILSQMTRSSSVQALNEEGEATEPYPLQLELTYRPHAVLGCCMPFLFGQCMLTGGGAFSATLPRNMAHLPVPSPTQAGRLSWAASSYKSLMLGPEGATPGANDRRLQYQLIAYDGYDVYPAHQPSQFHFHHRHQDDNAIVVKHHNSGLIKQQDPYWFSELRLARDELQVRKAITYYREHLDQLEAPDHRKLLEWALNKNSAYAQNDQRFGVVPNGGLLHHELVVDAENLIEQISSFIKAGLFKFQVEEKVEPLLFLARLSQQMVHHIEVAASLSPARAVDRSLQGSVPSPEAFLDKMPDIQGYLAQMLQHASLFTSDNDRGQIAKTVVILMGLEPGRHYSKEALQFGVAALAVTKATRTALNRQCELTELYADKAILQLEPHLEDLFLAMTDLQRDQFLYNALTTLERALPSAFSLSKALRIDRKPADRKQEGSTRVADAVRPPVWQGESPLFSCGDCTVNVSSGQVYVKQRPIGNRLPRNIADHPQFRALFGSEQPVCEPLSSGAYVIKDDRYRVKVDGSNLLIQQALQWRNEPPQWYQLSAASESELGEVKQAITAILPDTLHFWAPCGNQDGRQDESKQWLATSVQDPTQLLYRIQVRQGGEIDVAPMDRAERLNAVNCDRDDAVVQTLRQFEMPSYIAVWSRDTLDKAVSRVELKRFDFSFSLQSASGQLGSGELVWSEDEQYKLADRCVPLVGDFTGVLQLRDREEPTRGLLVIPRGSIGWAGGARQMPHGLLSRQLQIASQVDAAVGTQLGSRSYVTVPFKVSAAYTEAGPHDLTAGAEPMNELLPRDCEERLRLALLAFATRCYEAAVSLLREARTLKTLSEHEWSAVNALIDLANVNDDRFADAVATRLHVHLFVLDNAQGMGQLEYSHVGDLITILPRYIEQINNVDTALQLSSSDLREVRLRLQEAFAADALLEEGRALTHLSPQWSSVQLMVDRFLNHLSQLEDGVSTVHSKSIAPAQSYLTLSNLHRDDDRLLDFFTEVFNSRKRPLSVSKLLAQVDQLPIVAPDASDFKSLFKSILLLMQGDLLHESHRRQLKSRIRLVDASASEGVAHTRQLLLLLLEQSKATLRTMNYPMDSWQKPTNSGSNGHYRGSRYQDTGSLDELSVTDSGRYRYSVRRSHYSDYYDRREYYDDYCSSYRGSFNTYDTSGRVQRVSEEIDCNTYVRRRQVQRTIFVSLFRPLYPTQAEVERSTGVDAHAHLMTPSMGDWAGQIDWLKQAAKPKAPAFVLQARQPFRGPYSVLAHVLGRQISWSLTAYERPNILNAADKKVDITSLYKGALVDSAANHVAVLEEQTALYRDHLDRWFDQSVTSYQFQSLSGETASRLIAQRSTGPHETAFDPKALADSLASWVADQRPQLQSHQEAVVAFANRHTDHSVDQRRQLAAMGRNHQPLTWGALTLRLGQRNVQALVESNPSLSDKRLKALNDRMIVLLLLETALQQAERALGLLQDYTQLQRSAGSVPNDALKGELKKIESDIAAVLATQRHYDVHQYPEYLVWEATGGIILRANQIEVLDQLLHQRLSARSGVQSGAERPSQEAVMQLIMGAGKTKALLPLYMALVPKTGDRLPVAMVPKPLLEINASDLSYGLRNAFGQMGYTFSYGRQSDTSQPHLIDMLKRLERTVAEQGYMITSRESIQALELKLQELMESALVSEGPERAEFAAQADRLAAFINRFSEVSDVLIDEIDNGLDARFEVNYTVGKQQGLLPGRLDLVTTLFEALMDTVELPFANKLRANEQASIGASAYSVSAKTLLVREVLTRSPHFDAVRSNVESPEMIDYLVGRAKQPPQALHVLAQSIEHRETAQLLVLLKEQVNTLLPVTLSKSGGESYGFSIKNPDSFLPGPRDKGKHKEGSNFANPYETLNYLYQLVLDDHFTWDGESLKQWVVALQAAQQTEIAESPMDPEETLSHGIFMDVIVHLDPSGASDTLWHRLGLARLEVNNRSMMRQLSETVNQQPLARLWLARHLAAADITQAPRKLSNNPYDLVDVLGLAQGFSGTLWNSATYSGRLSSATVAETDGKVTKILMDVDKSDRVGLTSKAPAALLTELADKGAIRPNTRAFIDAGALFRGLSGEEVADALLDHFSDRRASGTPAIKAVLYFDREDCLILKWQDRSSQIMPNTDPETLASTGLQPGERFTYYDQPRTVGTDIGQSPQAHALVSIGLNTTKRDWFQGLLRMRKPDTQSFTIVVPESVMEKVSGQGAMLRGLRGTRSQEVLPSMGQLLGHAISNESERLSLDKFRAGTQQIKNSVIRPLKQGLLSLEGDERISVYGCLQGLLSEALVDDPLTTMVMINRIETKQAMFAYRDALLGRLTRHYDDLIAIGRATDELQGVEGDEGETAPEAQALKCAQQWVKQRMVALTHFDMEALFGRLGALPLSVRSAGMESFGSEVQTEQELELELELEAEHNPDYEKAPPRPSPVRALPWRLETTVYQQPNLLALSRGRLGSAAEPQLFRVSDFGQSDFYSERLQATSNFLKTSNKEGADLFANMKVCGTQKPVEMLLIHFDRTSASASPAAVVLSVEDQVFFMNQLAKSLTAEDRKGALRELCLLDLSGKILRAGNSGLSQEMLDQNEAVQRLRVQAKLLNAPVDRFQLWSPEDQRQLAAWLRDSTVPQAALKKEYLKLFAKKLNLNLS